MIFHKIIEAKYRSAVCVRFDDTGLMHYFDHLDFPGMEAQPYEFRSRRGDILRGNIYSYPGCRDDRLLIFDHGIGGGHLSYMMEIERLCRAGYRVLAYDHTGSRTSEGEGAGGLGRSLCDLSDCISSLTGTSVPGRDRISVMGHSWGGYAALNIPALHPEVEQIVVMSGFISVKRMIDQIFTGLLRFYRRHIYALERQLNGDCFDCDGISALQGCHTPAMLIYSDDDAVVKKASHYDPLSAALSDRPDTELILTHGKGHNPNYTHAALAEMKRMGKALPAARKLKTPGEKAAFRDSYDWRAMTEQDSALWERILIFLDKKKWL